MAGTDIQMTAQKQLSLPQICQKLNSIGDVERVAHIEHSDNDVHSVLLVYERYYVRVSSYASLTVLLTEHGQTQTADVIACGGGDGYLNFSLGANRNFAREYAKALEECGFTSGGDSSAHQSQGIFAKLGQLFE